MLGQTRNELCAKSSNCLCRHFNYYDLQLFVLRSHIVETDLYEKNTFFRFIHKLALATANSQGHM